MNWTGVLGPRGGSRGREGVPFPYRREHGGAAAQGVLQGASGASRAVQVGWTVDIYPQTCVWYRLFDLLIHGSLES